MTSSIHETMHKEHKRLDAEISFWREEVALWQKELAETDRDFASLKKAFDDQAELLRKHAAAIRMREQDADTHEHALALFEMGGAGQDLIGYAQKHEKEMAAQVEQRQAHENLKRHFHALMAQWKRLVKTFVPQGACEPTQGRTSASEYKASQIIQ